MDAPEGHPAYSKVSISKDLTYVRFQYTGLDGKKTSIQTTVKACGGRRSEAERICRLCYVKFANGCSKDEVLQYREQLYEESCRSTSVNMLHGNYLGKQAKAGTAIRSLEGIREPHREADAPEFHPAYEKTKVVKDGRVVEFDFVTGDGQMIHFQTTAGACGGSRFEAERICRLCYMKFEEGWSHGDVLKYRAALYRQSGFRRLCGGCSSAPPMRPSQPNSPSRELKLGRPSKSLPACFASWISSKKAKFASDTRAISPVKQVLLHHIPSMPWPALHGEAAVMTVVDDCKRSGEFISLVQQIRKKDISALSALQKRYCRKRTPRSHAQQLSWHGARDVLMEFVGGEAASAGWIVNHLVQESGDFLVVADLVANHCGSTSIAEAWRDLAVDQVMIGQSQLLHQ